MLSKIKAQRIGPAIKYNNKDEIQQTQQQQWRDDWSLINEHDQLRQPQLQFKIQIQTQCWIQLIRVFRAIRMQHVVVVAVAVVVV